MATVDVLRYSLELDSKKFVAQAKKSEQATKKLSNTISSKLTTAVQGMVGAWLGYRALNIVGDLVKAGAQAEATGLAFENMFGRQTDIIEKMRIASRGTINEVSMMTIAMKANVMGITQETLPQLMEVARASAIAFGQSTEFMFDSIVTGIARKQPLILDNLGIIVNLTEVYKNETERLGHELSEAEKSQALLTATIAAGQETIRKVGVDAKTSAEDIQSLAAAWTDLTTEIGKATTSVTGAGGWLSTIMDQVAWRIKLNRLLAESYELQRKAAAFIGPVPIKGFDIPLFTQTVEAARMDLRKILNEWDIGVKKIWHDLGVTSTEQLIEYFEMMLREYNLTAEQIKAIEKEIFNYRLQLMKQEAEERIKFEKTLFQIHYARFIQGIRWMEGFAPPGGQPTSPTGAMLPSGPGFGGALTKELETATDDMLNIWRSFLASMGNQMEGFIGGVASLADSLVSVGIQSIVNNFINTLMNGFRQAERIEAERREAQRRAIENLNRAYERNINLIERMTIAENEARERQLRAIIEAITRRMNADQTMFRSMDDMILAAEDLARLLGIDILDAIEMLQFAGVEWLQAWRDELDALQGSMADLEAIRGIESLQDLMAFLSGIGDLDYETASQLARHFSRMFDMTVEQQIEMWEAILAMLEMNGNINQDSLFSIEEILKGLYDQAEEQHEDNRRAMQPESQIMRSITMITENQANLMISVLNSIYITLRQFLDEFRGMVAGFDFRGIGGATGTSIGQINITGGASTAAITESINREFRARGIKLG